MRGLGFKLVLWICCGWFTMLGVDVLAQVNNYINFTVDDGLPSNEVYHVIEDEQGYIWFATDKGVSRFNGYEFENFTTEDGLHNNVIFQLYEDTVANRIWCTGLGGALSIIKLEDLDFEKVSYSQEMTKYVQTDKYILDARGDTTIIHSAQGVGEFYVDRSVVSQANLVFKSEVPCVDTSMVPFYLLKRYHDKGKTFVESCGNYLKFSILNFSRLIPLLKEGYSKDRMVAVQLDSTTFLVKEANSFFRIGHNKKAVYFEQLAGIRGMWVSEGVIRVVTANGIYTVSQNDGSHVKFQQDSFFSDISGTSMLISSSEGEWFTSREQGVFFLRSSFNKILDSKHGLLNSAVNKLFPAGNNGSFWISYFGLGKISRYIPRKKKFRHSLISDKEEVQTWLPVTKDSVVVGTQTKFYLFNLRNFNTTQLFNGGSARLYNPNTKNLWVHKESRAGKLVNGKLDESTKMGDPQLGVSTDEQMLLYRDTVWSGGVFGLGYVNEKDQWQADTSIDFDRVKGLGHFNHQYMAVATLGKGLYLAIDNSWIQITEKDGLISNLCNGVYVDNFGEIWVYSNSGVSHITLNPESPAGYDIFNYDAQDGLLSTQVNDVLRLENTTWVATGKGINVIDLEYEQLPKRAVSVLITAVETDDSTSVSKVAQDFEYNTSIEINYLAVDIKKLGNITYEYRVLGLDPVWRKTKSRSVRLPKLEDGNYTFEVRVFDPSPKVKPQSATFNFAVIAPFWKTWWFLLLCGFLIAAVIRFRFAQLREKSKLKTELLDVRRQALAAQMNPHFLFNSFNSIRNFVLQNDKEKADEYIVRFSELTRGILNNSFKETITLQQELDMIANYLDIERMRVHNKFDYDIAISPDVEADVIEIPPAVLHPFVENAVWHGVKELTDRQGKIDIRCFVEGAYLVCQIQDNGKGFEKTPKKDPRKQKSFGIDITKQRLELVQSAYHQQVQVDVSSVQKNGVVSGVLVTLKFKLNHG